LVRDLVRSGNSEACKLDEIELLRVLYIYNPWWDSGKVPSTKAPEFKRRDYYKLLKTVENQKITAIVGARRIGKTTLMYQLIEHVISKVGPSRVMYVSLDDLYLKITIESLKAIFDLYSKYILKESLFRLEKPVYFFLDEIQFLQNWESVLKRWFDLGYNVKFFISGSSSVNILTGTAESLVGRIAPQIVFPMKFLETVRFRVKEKSFEKRLDNVNWQVRKSLQDGIRRENPYIFYSALQDNANILARDIDRFILSLQDYLVKGGYPEVVAAEDLYQSAENLRNYLHLTIYRDIVRTFNIRDPVAFEELITVLAKESSHRMNYSELANTLGLKRQTLKAYLYYLKTAFLISESEYYSRSRMKRIRREKKVYVNDPGIRNVTVAAFSEYLLKDSAELGKVVESVVADHCKRLKFNLEPASELQLFYWKSQGYETDIIIELLQRPIPIEVKYKDRISEKDLRGLRDFAQKHRPPFSLVVTREKLELSGNTVRIPLWLFLIMC